VRRVALLVLLSACSEPRDVGEGSWAGHYSCASGTANSPGIDVSGYQPNTDWQMASGAGGLQWAIIKASEGVTYTNNWFAQDWAGTKANGMVRGAYCFFRAAADPVAEADYFLAAVDAAGGFERGDIAAMDLECPTDADCMPAATVAANALAWLERVKEKTGITPIIYTSARVFDTVLGTPAGFGGYPLWDANWDVPCPTISTTWKKWAIWQYAGDSLTFPGVMGINDGDMFNGTKDEMVAWANSLWPPLDTPDAGPRPDARVVPETGGQELAGGCGCAVARERGGRAPWLLFGLSAGTTLWRRRRRSTRRTR
jgi:lysozyme